MGEGKKRRQARPPSSCVMMMREERVHNFLSHSTHISLPPKKKSSWLVLGGGPPRRQQGSQACFFFSLSQVLSFRPPTQNLNFLKKKNLFLPNDDETRNLLDFTFENCCFCFFVSDIVLSTCRERSHMQGQITDVRGFPDMLSFRRRVRCLSLSRINTYTHTYI